MFRAQHSKLKEILTKARKKNVQSCNKTKLFFNQLNCGYGGFAVLADFSWHFYYTEAAEEVEVRVGRAGFTPFTFHLAGYFIVYIKTPVSTSFIILSYTLETHKDTHSKELPRQHHGWKSPAIGSEVSLFVRVSWCFVCSDICRNPSRFIHLPR